MYLLVFLDVGVKLRRVCEVLVHIVEVSQDHIAPEDELIQWFCLWEEGFVAIVQFEQQAHSVGGLRTCYFVEEIVNSQHLRSNDRAPKRLYCFAQVFLEEHLASPVGENKATAGDASCLDIVVGYLFKEWSHLSNLVIIFVKI